MRGAAKPSQIGGNVRVQRLYTRNTKSIDSKKARITAPVLPLRPPAADPALWPAMPGMITTLIEVAFSASRSWTIMADPADPYAVSNA
jgi:hypothetical protein